MKKWYLSMATAMIVIFLASCSNSSKNSSKSNSDSTKQNEVQTKNNLPQELGIFYNDNGDYTPLKRGTANGINSRAIKITNNSKPEFIYYLDDKLLGASDMVFAINLSIQANQDGRYTPVGTTVIPVEGKSNMYRITPKTVLPKGLTALVFSESANKIYTDINNVWPFIVE
jgi:hypothetical protein